MAYGEVFYQTWTDTENIEHEIKLLQDGYAGSSTLIPSVSVTPFSVYRRGSKTAPLDQHVWGKEMVFKFHVPSASTSTYDAIFESEYKEWKLEHYYNSSLVDVGWVLPDNFSRIWHSRDAIFEYSLSATDGLAKLKDIEFTNFSTGAQYSDRVSLITTIKRALEHLEFELDFRVHLNTYEETLMSLGECPLDKVTCDNGRFTKIKDGIEVNEDCNSIIEKILRPFNAYISQIDGYYWIWSPQEVNANTYPIPWSTLTVGSASSELLNLVVTGYDFADENEIQKIKPFGKVLVNFRDRNVQDNLITNGDFASGTTNWTNVGYTSFSVVSEEARVEYVTADDDGAYFKYQDIAITPTGEDDQIYVEFDVKLNSVTYDSGDRAPRAQLKLYTTGGTLVGASTYREIGTEWQKVTAYISISQDTDYELRFYVVSHPVSDITASSISFDNIYANVVYQSSDDVTFDRLYTMTNDDSFYVDSYETDLYFGDSTGDSDIAAFKVGGTRTESWSRKGSTDQVSLQELYMQNIIEWYQEYNDYLRFAIYDPNHNIKPYTLLFFSAPYMIVSSSILYENGVERLISCECIRLRNYTSSVNTTTTIQSLTSVDGQSSGSANITTIVSGTSTGQTLQEVTDLGSTTDNDMAIERSENSIVYMTIDNVNTGSSASAGIGFDTDGGYSIIFATSAAYTSFPQCFVYQSSALDHVWLHGTAERMRIDYTTGNIGINDSTPTYKLDVNGTFRAVQDATFDADVTASSFATTNVDIETGGTYIIDATGTVNATDFRATSDLTVKEEIEPIRKASDILKKLSGYHYFNKESERYDFGLLAQFVEKVIKEPVQQNQSGKYSLNYNSFIPILLEGWKESEKRIQKLESNFLNKIVKFVLNLFKWRN